MPEDRVMAHIRWGGYAEEAVVDEALVAPVPAGLDFTVAASFGLVYATAYHALRDRAGIKAGETLLVLRAAGGGGPSPPPTPPPPPPPPPSPPPPPPTRP